MVALALVAFPAQALASTSQSSPVGVDQSAARGAAERAASAAHAYRSSAGTLLQGYQTRFGSRLTPAESSRVAELTRRGLAALGTLDRRAQRTAALARQGASATRINAARQAAIAAHAQASAQLQAAVTEVQPLLARHLGLFEGLQAKADLDRSMRELDDVGSTLRAIPVAR